MPIAVDGHLGEEPTAEIVNRDLASFVEFLYRYALRLKHVAGVSDRQADEYTARLREYLAARDPYAFAAPDSWWNMVFGALTDQDRPPAPRQGPASALRGCQWVPLSSVPWRNAGAPNTSFRWRPTRLP
ncbi:SUKH-4 family immunity protein [Kitasatospora cineracea]|uniref:SUKH-4 family immunity protein n=1 Tax=Kitasatospora cineracea TaxID=88074 RepID=UPI00381E6394